MLLLSLLLLLLLLLLLSLLLLLRDRLIQNPVKDLRWSALEKKYSF